MAFYTPAWLRKLIKEDAEYISKYLTKDRTNDFRSYVDSRFPFVLWLEMGEIRDKVLKPNMSLLDKAVELAFEESQRAWARDTLEKVLLNAYKKVINDYIDSPRFKELSYEELNSLLAPLNTLEVGQIGSYLNKVFSNKTYRIGGSLSKRNKCVMLLAPKFNTIDFGTRFRDAIDLSLFGTTDLLELDKSTGEYVQSAYSKIKDILEDTTRKLTGKKQDFFNQLQNVGHIEIDVVSEQDRTVKRGQVSPRFLQALVSVPNKPGVISRLQSDFSKQTLQNETRVLIRKKFSGSKLVFEMLVEYGIPVGVPESQVTNLRKASKEAAFGPGSGLTAEIRKNPKLLIELETSKSIKKYLEENLKSLIQTGKNTVPYTSTFSTTEKVSRSVNVVKVKKISKKISSDISTKVSRPTAVQRRKPANISAVQLQELINSLLHDQIKKNMGTGTDRRVLNYRTGRLARSAKVERISESRQGMITAFYSYMKNPYATFSEGGRQQYPRSRDPKTLISKSVREIAQTLVTNQLRAVNV